MTPDLGRPLSLYSPPVSIPERDYYYSSTVPSYCANRRGSVGLYGNRPSSASGSRGDHQGGHQEGAPINQKLSQELMTSGYRQ